MKNADIARRARILRKQNKIQVTWTRNSKVMIPEESKVLTIRELKELDQYDKWGLLYVDEYPW